MAFSQRLKKYSLFGRTENIAASIPYPKIEKKVPYYLTENEFNELLEYATQKANNLMGLRNLIIFMILGLLGLRLKALQNLNIEDVNLDMGVLLVQEKGAITRRFYMPQILSAVLAGKRRRTLYLNSEITKILSEWLAVRTRFLGSNKSSALFLSKKGNRLAIRTMEDNFKNL